MVNGIEEGNKEKECLFTPIKMCTLAIGLLGGSMERAHMSSMPLE